MKIRDRAASFLMPDTRSLCSDTKTPRRDCLSRGVRIHYDEINASFRERDQAQILCPGKKFELMLLAIRNLAQPRSTKQKRQPPPEAKGTKMSWQRVRQILSVDGLRRMNVEGNGDVFRFSEDNYVIEDGISFWATTYWQGL